MSSKTQVSSRLLAIKLLLIAGTSSGCGVAAHSGSSESLTLSASPEGLRAFSDMLAGAATNAKASPDADTAYYQLRREQNRAQAMRYAPSFLNKGGK